MIKRTMRAAPMQQPVMTQIFVPSLLSAEIERKRERVRLTLRESGERGWGWEIEREGQREREREREGGGEREKVCEGRTGQRKGKLSKFVVTLGKKIECQEMRSFGRFSWSLVFASCTKETNDNQMLKYRIIAVLRCSGILTSPPPLASPNFLAFRLPHSQINSLHSEKNVFFFELVLVCKKKKLL